MSDFFELDFLDVERSKSGDAIAIRYEINGKRNVHIVDGGFKGSENEEGTGDKILNHIKKYYGSKCIDRVIVTHPDGDHAGGLRKVLEDGEVKELWMLKPWDYVDELIDRFPRFKNKDNLVKRLKECYPNIDALEKIANQKNIPIKEPFQGAKIGGFTVLAPTKERYLNLIAESEKTPESITMDSLSEENQSLSILKKIIKFIHSVWGEENLSTEKTSPENEMSVIQYSELNSKRILLTGDAGRDGLEEARKYLVDYLQVQLPGIDYFQVPHHGSRRNVSSELLDQILGEKLPSYQEKFTAIISAANKDKDHPRKAVLRALMHRGAKVITTEGKNICCRMNIKSRDGWSSITPVEYPEDQEE